MRSKRIWGAGALCATIVAVLAIGGGASGSSRAPIGPGIVYGGDTSQHAVVWVRLSPDRRSVVNLHLDWSASRSQCADGKPMRGMPEDLGVENGFPAIRIHGGRFVSSVPEVAETDDGMGPERFNIAGTVTDTEVHGTFSGTVQINLPAGGHYVCKLGRTAFRAAN